MARGANHILERSATQVPLVAGGAEHVARQAAPVPSPRRLVWLNLVEGAPIVWSRAADEGAPPLVRGNGLILGALQRPSLEVLAVASVAQHAPRQEIPVTSPRSLTGFHAMESGALVGAVATRVSTAQLPAKFLRDGGNIPGRGGARCAPVVSIAIPSDAGIVTILAEIRSIVRMIPDLRALSAAILESSVRV